MLKIFIKHIILLLLLLGVSMQFLFATHNRAGEITLRQVKDLTYEITITTYTYTLSGADRPELEVQWGDNTTSISYRDPKLIVILPNNYRRNVYISLHTFPGPGTYTIVVQDPNRNLGVKNIPNSVNVIFSIKTTITINPQIGQNNTPVLLNPPFDKAGLYQKFIHNPGAYDTDGDSISYSLTVCTQQNGDPIPGYTLPKSSDTLYVNPVTGDLVWDSPIDTGIYNIAMNISEWRQGIKIGNIARDMQIEVYRTTNLPPVNDSLPKLCVVAGTPVIYDIRSTDANLEDLRHFITGGPFLFSENPASVSPVSNKPGEIITRFTWLTSCEHVRSQPYSVLVKTNDSNPKLSLVDIDNLEINVLGPPPQQLKLIPASNLIRVQWKAGECSNISHYNIYRRTGASGYIPDSCTYGLPGYAGFALAGKTKNGTDSIFIDDNSGRGLMQGTDYCYRIVAVYPDGAESIPSDEACTILIPGSPSILNTSVTKIDETDGEIFLSWARPHNLDTIPGPYEYVIYRADNLFGLNLNEINRFTTNDLNDTVFYDKNLNTIKFPYSYSVELYIDSAGFRSMYGKPEIVSTLYPGLSETDNTIGLKFVRNVPWLNYETTVYRFDMLTKNADSIFNTTGDFYSDVKLENNREYCYQIKSKGHRTIDGIEYFTENYSHAACGTPRDTVPPCPPDLVVSSKCDSAFNALNWTLTNLTCAEDVVKYNIYYTSRLSVPHSLLDSTVNMSYNHFPQTTLAACYYVTAVDSFGNESKPSTNICIDNCYNFEIPNVFSPDGDGINDILYSSLHSTGPSQFVERIDMKIFNRWGQLIFQTDDPEINWNGKIDKTNQTASSGVYYYICDVFERRLTGIEPRNIVGFIHVYSDKHAKAATK